MYGNYTIRAIAKYTDPNGNAKIKYTNSTVYVNPYKNISAIPTIPTMSVGISNPATATITNLGNIGLEEIKTTLRIFNSSGAIMNWSMIPGNSTHTNVSFGGN